MRFAARGIAAALCCAVGGATAAAQTPTARVIRGVVTDSLTNAPLADARVALINRGDPAAAPRSTTTDSLGAFQFAGVAPGEYLVGFQAPVLDSIGIKPALRLVQLAPSGSGPVTVDLAVASGRTIHDAFCPNRPPTDSTSVLIGHLSDASTRGAIAAGVVHANWLSVFRGEHNVGAVPASEETQTTDDGWFALCDLPAGQPVQVVATAQGDTSGVVDLIPPETRGLLRHEIYLARASAPHTGTLVGIVRATRDRQPLANAEVSITGTSAATKTDANGRFDFHGLPYGSFSVSVTAAPYEAQQQPVDVLADSPDTVTIAMLTRAEMLDSAVAVAARSIAQTHGFWRRRQEAESHGVTTHRRGRGGYYDFDEIARAKVFALSQLVERAMGFPEVDARAGGDEKRKDADKLTCWPAVYVDSALQKNITTPQELDAAAPLQGVAAVEIVPSAFLVEFPRPSLPNVCGVVVVWMLPPSLRAAREPGGT